MLLAANASGADSVSPPAETSIAIVSTGYLSAADISGFHNAYPYLAGNFQEFYIDGTFTTPDAEGTMDVEWATVMANSFGAAANTAKIYLYDGADSNFSTITDALNYVPAHPGRPSRRRPHGDSGDGTSRNIPCPQPPVDLVESPPGRTTPFGLRNSMPTRSGASPPPGT